jgi:hypothetical protein
VWLLGTGERSWREDVGDESSALFEIADEEPEEPVVLELAHPVQFRGIELVCGSKNPNLA